MRTLCLNLNGSQPNTSTESFLAFSSRLRFRKPGLIFADITDSAKTFGSESAFLKELQNFNREFYPAARAAIGSSPTRAQLLQSGNEDYFTCAPEDESPLINQLSLSALHNLEGLVAWNSQQEVEDIITFFKVLGYERIGDIQDVGLQSFQQRWGKTGELLWKRLHGFEKQVITPIKNNVSVVDYIDLQTPISLRSYLLHTLEKHVRDLLNQVKSRRHEAEKLVIFLYGLHNYDIHVIEVAPNADYLNLVWIYEELDRKLGALDFSNPIKRIDIEIFACQPVGSRAQSWHREGQKKLNSARPVQGHLAGATSGYFPPNVPESDCEDWLDSNELHEDTDNLALGYNLQMDLKESQIAFKRPLRQVLQQPLEISDITKYQFLSDFSFTDCGVEISQDRGWHYFLVADRKHRHWCVAFDQLQMKYYLVGRA